MEVEVEAAAAAEDRGPREGKVASGTRASDLPAEAAALHGPLCLDQSFVWHSREQ